ncbi:MAG: hypothetical protein JW969_02085 [Spirochaetales bacterium]|nr:hypothetical protein [Spirochaetales bacterium]
MDQDSEKFKTALMRDDLFLLRKVKKSDKHNHGIYGITCEDLLEITGGKFKKRTKKLWGLFGFGLYLRKLRPYTTTREIYEKILEKMIITAINDGVRLLESSMDINFLKFYGYNIKPFLDFIITLKTRYKNSIQFRPELGINRPPKFQVVEKYYYPLVDSGVFDSIDTYGKETNAYDDYLIPLYRYAKKKGLKTKIHTGEMLGPKAIEKTILKLDIDEIQHGIHAAKSNKTMRLIRDKNITLNVCPSSNVALRVVKSLKAHPVRQLVDSGINVTINTDDLAIFHSTVSNEYWQLYKEKVLSIEELNRIREWGLSILS